MATVTKAKTKRPTVKVTLSTFDQSARPVYRVLREGVTLKDFTPIGEDQYKPEGNTPLLDATYEFLTHMRKLANKSEAQVGLLLDESYSMNPNRQAVIESVNKFVDGLREVKKVDPEVAGKGFMVITTDGFENMSRKRSYEDVGKLVRKCEREGWVLIFLGANIDAWNQGSKLSLSGGVTGQTVSTVSTPAGTASAFGHVHKHSVGYLTDSQGYARFASSEGTVRSLAEDGSVTDQTPNWTQSSSAAAPHTHSPNMGVYDPEGALKDVQDRLGS